MIKPQFQCSVMALYHVFDGSVIELRTKWKRVDWCKVAMRKLFSTLNNIMDGQWVRVELWQICIIRNCARCNGRWWLRWWESDILSARGMSGGSLVGGQRWQLGWWEINAASSGSLVQGQRWQPGWQESDAASDRGMSYGVWWWAKGGSWDGKVAMLWIVEVCVMEVWW